MVTVKQLIPEFEEALGLKFSPEQKAILEFKPNRQLLVNACAGSGKTTLIMIKMLLLVTTHQIAPQLILGITFSHDAAQNMRDKYKEYSEKLLAHGIHVPSIAPYFSTFHALFYHMVTYLKGVRNLPVLQKSGKLTYALMKGLDNTGKDKYVSRKERLKKIMSLRSGLIANAYSFNGLDTVNPKDNINTLVESVVNGSTTTDNAQSTYNSYFDVNGIYNKWKKVNHCIDFNDMEMIIFKVFVKEHTNPMYANAVKHVKTIGDRYQLCFIDEFQDISTVQLYLMKHILSKDTWNRVTVVGDDDQSIYSFRGANPNIIMNFKHHSKNAKQLNLSINYRTGNNILKATKPMITKNKYRLGGKGLKSANKKPNRMVKYISKTPKQASSQAILTDIQKLINNPKIPDSKIAILTRYNFYKAILCDWLANHQYYTKSNILFQNTKTYKALVDPLRGIVYNNTYFIYRSGNKLPRDYGMSFRKHMCEVLTYYFRSKQQRFLKSFMVGMPLSFYLKHALKFDVKSEHRAESNVAHADEDLSTALKASRDKKTTLDSILALVKHLENNYLDYMCDNSFLNPEHIDLTFNYLTNEMKKCKNGHKFFTNENNKRMHVMLSHSQNKLNLLTMHQSKGLQFPYVFLYNLDQSYVTQSMLAEDKYFAPNTKPHEFVSIIAHLSKKALRELDRDDDKLHYHHAHDDVKEALKNHDKIKLDDIYSKCLSDCQEVESGRRLLYVGCTRASQFLGVNIAKYASPFLAELKVPNTDFKVIGKDNKVRPLVENKKLKAQKVNAQIKKLKKEAKDLKK